MGLPVKRHFNCVAKGDQEWKYCFEPRQDFGESVFPRPEIIHCFIELQRQIILSWWCEQWEKLTPQLENKLNSTG